ncbi:DEAH-box ATP-dependent RNA helicase prp43, partial [Modicella reniformis]
TTAEQAESAAAEEGALNPFTTNKAFSAKYRKFPAGRRKLPVNKHHKEFLDFDPEQPGCELGVALFTDRTEDPGDILLFLAEWGKSSMPTGSSRLYRVSDSLHRGCWRYPAEEIEHACRKIKHEADQMPGSAFVKVLPLFSTLPPQAQKKMYEDTPPTKAPGRRIGHKIVVSSKVAEQSMGLCLSLTRGSQSRKVYNPASAQQHSGRPGKCLRLCTEGAFMNELIETTYPESLRSNLGTVVL